MVYGNDRIVRRKKTGYDDTATIPTEILAITDDQNVFNDFLYLFTADYSQDHNISHVYVSNFIEHYYFAVRVFFEESDDIVWDAYIGLYYDSNSLSRDFVIDTGRTVSGLYTRIDLDYTIINDLPYLFEFISDAIEAKENEQTNN